MNRIEITTNGPVKENLNLVRVADDYENDSLHLDHADVVKAAEDGTLLALIAENIGEKGRSILSDAVTNSSPVSLDDQDVDLAALVIAMGMATPAPRA